MKKRIGLLSFLLLACFVFQTAAFAADDGFHTSYTYTYNYWDEATPSPDAYRVKQVINSASLGLEKGLRRPQSLFVRDGHLFIADTGNDRVIELDKTGDDAHVVRIIDRVSGAEPETLSSPQDVFVSENGSLYIADTNNNRVVMLDRDGVFLRSYTKPTDKTFNEEQSFLPDKVVADHAGRIYVLATNVNKGLMKYEADGTFVGFIGANRVTTTMFEYIRKYYLMTEAQQAQTVAFVPTEYSNITIDKKGFIYAVTNVFDEKDLLTDKANPVRRLNGLGQDILVKNGKYAPVGDVIWNEQDGPSRFTDVTVLDNDMYVVFDRVRGRLFEYDSQGILLWTFGSPGSPDGSFTSPVSLEHIGRDLLCLDQVENSITVLTPTEYGNLVYEAYQYYDDGRYEDSAAVWEEVKARNVNYDPVYIGIGRSLLRQDKYKEAMECFRLAHNQENYGIAFKYYRKEWVERNVGYIATGLALLILTPIVLKSVRHAAATVRGETEQTEKKVHVRSRFMRSFLYAFHIIVHPFDGFWDLIHEKKGSLSAATAWLAAFLVTYVIKLVYTDFQFVNEPIRFINIFYRCAALLVPFLILCVGNWSMTTLFDGKGRLRDIYTAMCYALVPYVLLQLPSTLLSHALTYEEASLYNVITAISVIWCVLLVFVGLMEVHDYKPGKTLLFLVMTVFAACVILFLLLVIFSLLNDMLNYLLSIYREYIYRVH